MADKKISQLTSASTPLAGTEVLPLVQSGTTLKVTAENIFTTTQPSGNANGIVYLNGSKQATTSAAFFYNGSNLGINTSGVTAIYGKTIQIGDGSTNNTIYMVGSSGGAGFLANVGTVFSLTGRGSTTLAFGTNDVDRVTIDLNGNTSLLMGNLVLGTAGRGIDFSANTGAPGMTSELLNWYEEGTWTPTDASGAGLTFTVIKPRYTRIGRMVFVQVGLLYPATANTSPAQIGGLPFTSSADNDGTVTCLNSTALTLVGSIASSTNIIVPKEMGTTNTPTNARLTGAYVGFTGQYFV